MATRDVTGARHALLAGLIDHAALFPPASLPMDAAIEVDRAARATPHAWMLHRFLVPASRLVELPADFDPPLGVVVDVDELPPLSPQVEVLEARLERAPVVAGAAARVFLEVPAGDQEALDAVAEHGAGAKVRCGGATSDMFPSPVELARFVCGCRDRGLAFKATAGLHHPLRGEYRLTYEEGSPHGMMFGFLNVFLAAAFARTGLTLKELALLLEEKDADAFQFTETSASWRGNTVSRTEISAVRHHVALSFGSCSFQEPVDDLRSLGLL